MPQGSARAFILGSSPINEQDKFIYLLSQEKGLLKAIAPGSLKVKNRFGSLFELFTKGEFFYYCKEDKEIITISKGEIIKSYFNIVSNPENIFYFYLISEILLKSLAPNQQDKRVFKLMESILNNRVEGVEINFLLLYFLIWILRIEGMMFNPSICYNCFLKDINRAWVKNNFRGVLCEKCKNNEKFTINQEELNYIKWTEINPPKNSNIWKNKIDINKMIKLFVKKIESHTECTLNSSRYITELK